MGPHGHPIQPRWRLTMKVSKGLEFPVVALPSAAHMPAEGEDEQEAARVFYVAAARLFQALGLRVTSWRVNFDQQPAVR